MDIRQHLIGKKAIINKKYRGRIKDRECVIVGISSKNENAVTVKRKSVKHKDTFNLLYLTIKEK